MFVRFMTMAAVVVAMVGPTALRAVAQADTHCPSGQQPLFSGGFAQLKGLLADWQGDPISCEFADPRGNGDVLQQTNTGLAFWRKSTNLPSFTNGIDHWALTSAGLLYWSGASIDPPDDAQVGFAHPCLANHTCQPAVTAVAPAAPATPGPTAAPTPQTRNSGLFVVEPYPSDVAWSCFEANPSCSRDPWWAEWNELQDATHVTYAAVGARFITERRYVEAVDLLWQWPEGKVLLSQADRSGVLVITLDYDQQRAFATYSPQRKLIAINRRFTTTPTWMIADVLAHELSHAADDARGVNMEPYSTSSKLSPEQAGLAQSLYQIGLTGNLPQLVNQTYHGTC
jgi:hypothetical protein